MVDHRAALSFAELPVFAFATYLAQVAEVEVSRNGSVRVRRVVCAIDCGTVVNPDIVRAQVEGDVPVPWNQSARSRNDPGDGTSHRPLWLSRAPDALPTWADHRR
jgi:hypothetical protein